MVKVWIQLSTRFKQVQDLVSHVFTARRAQEQIGKIEVTLADESLSIDLVLVQDPACCEDRGPFVPFRERLRFCDSVCNQTRRADWVLDLGEIINDALDPTKFIWLVEPFVVLTDGGIDTYDESNRRPDQ